MQESNFTSTSPVIHEPSKLLEDLLEVREINVILNRLRLHAEELKEIEELKELNEDLYAKLNKSINETRELTVEVSKLQEELKELNGELDKLKSEKKLYELGKVARHVIADLADAIVEDEKTIQRIIALFKIVDSYTAKLRNYMEANFLVSAQHDGELIEEAIKIMQSQKEELDRLKSECASVRNNLTKLDNLTKKLDCISMITHTMGSDISPETQAQCDYILKSVINELI